MSETVDNRVVKMEFDNAKFQKNVSESMKSIHELNNSLKSLESGEYLKGLDDSISKSSFRNMEQSLDALNKRFSALGIVGMRMWSNITDSAMRFGSTLVNKVIAPMKSGGINRALNLEHANFQFKALGMDIEATMEDVNYAVDGTAYGLDAAAKVASQLGASGMKAGDQMKRALRGVSGVAAMTGSSYEDIGAIFTTISGQGRVMADQLNQLAGRGVNAAATLGKYLGKTEAQVREMVSKGQVDFATFADAMDDAFGEHAKDANKTFEGALSNMKSALNRIGADFATPYLTNMRDVFNAVRPWLNNLKSALQPVVKDSEKIMVGMNKRIVAALGDDNWVDVQINAVESFRNVMKGLISVFIPVSKAWKDVFPNSGIKNIKSFSEGVKALTSKLTLSNTSMNNLRYTMSGIFSLFKIGGDLLNNFIKLIFPITDGANGLIDSVLILTGYIGKMLTYGRALYDYFGGFNRVVKISENVLLSFVTLVGSGVLSVYEFAKKIGIVEVGVKTARGGIALLSSGIAYLIKMFDRLSSLNPGKIFERFGIGISSSIKETSKTGGVLSFLKDFSLDISSLGGKTSKSVTNLKNYYNALKNFISGFVNFLKNGGAVIEFVASSFEKIIGLVNEFWDGMGGLDGVISNSSSALGILNSKFLEFISELTPGKIAAFAFSIAFVSMAMSIRKAAENFSVVENTITKTLKSFQGFLGSLKDAISNGFKKPKSTLENFRDTVIVLTGALVAMSLLDQDKLAHSIAMLSVLFVEMAAFGLVSKKFGKNFNGVSKSIVIIAGAVALLAGSLLLMDKIDLENGIVAKLGIVAAIMVALGITSAIMGKISPQLSQGSLSILAFALGVTMIIKSLNSLNDFKVENINDKLKVIVVMFGTMAVLSHAMGAVKLRSIVGFVALMGALKYAFPTIQTIFSSVDTSGVIKSIKENIAMFGLISALALAIGVAFDRVGSGFGKIGTGLLAMSLGLAVITKVTKGLMKMDFDSKKFPIIKEFILQLLGIMGLIVLATRFGNGENVKSIGTMMIGISTALLIAVGAGKLLSTVDPEMFNSVVGSIEALIALFGIVALCASFAKEVDTKSLTVALIGIVALAGEMIVLTLIPWQSLVPAAGAISAVMLAFGGTIALIGQSKINKKKLAGIITAALVAVEFAGILAILSKYDWKNLAAAGGTMTLTMLTFSKLVDTVTSTKGLRDIGKVKTLVTAAILFVALAGGLAILARYDWKSITASGVAMGITMLVFTQMIEMISSRTGLKTNKILPLLGIAVAMLPMAASLAILSKYDWQSITAAGGMMSVALLAIAGSLSILGSLGAANGLAAAGSIVIVAGGMLLLATAMERFVGIQWGDLGKAAAVLGAITLVLGGLAGIVVATGGLFAVGLIAVAGAFAIFGAAVLAAGGGIMLAASGMNLLLPILQEMTNLDLVVLGEQMKALAVGIGLLGLAGVPMMMGAPGILAGGLALAVFGPAISQMAGVDFTNLGTQLPALAGGLTLLGLSGVALALGATGLLAAGGAMILLVPSMTQLSGLDLSTIGNGLITVAGGCALIGAAGIVMITGAPGILATGGALVVLAGGITVAGEAFTSTAEAIRSAFDTNISTLASDAIKAGEDAAAGLVNGIKSKLQNILQAGKTMALTVLNGIREAGGWASPWVTTDEAGTDAVIGLENGSIAELPSLKSIWQKITNDGIVATVKDTVAKVKNFAQNISGSFGETITNAVNLDDVLDKFAGDTLEEVEESVEEDTESMDDFGESIESVGGKAAKTESALDKMTDTISNQMDIFSKFEKKTDMTGETMLENMRSQIEGVSEWATNLQMLAVRGLDQGLLKKLGDLGPQGYEKVNAFVQMTDEQLVEANQLFAQSMVLPDSASKAILASFANAGTMVSTGFEDGIDTTAGNEKAEEMGANALNALNKELDIHSPSRKTYETGKNVDEGLAQGIKNNMRTTIMYVETFCRTIVKLFQKELDAEKFTKIGADAVKGFIVGIKENMTEIGDLSTEIGEKTVESTKKALDEHSPSKKMYQVASMAIAGFLLALRSGISEVEDTSSDLGDIVINSIGTAVKTMNDMFESGVTGSPVIVPVVDLSNVSASASEISDMFNREYLLNGLNESIRFQNQMASGSYTSQRDREDYTRSMLETIAKQNSKLLNGVKDAVESIEIQPVPVNVGLYGNANKFFRAMVDENNKTIAATRYNPLSNQKVKS